MAMYHTGCYEKQIENDSISDSMKGTLKHGSFDEAPPEIAEKTGKKNYDFEMTFWDGGMVSHASITDNGTRMIMKPMFPTGDPLGMVLQTTVEIFQYWMFLEIVGFLSTHVPQLPEIPII